MPGSGEKVRAMLDLPPGPYMVPLYCHPSLLVFPSTGKEQKERIARTGIISAFSYKWLYKEMRRQWKNFECVHSSSLVCHTRYRVTWWWSEAGGKGREFCRDLWKERQEALQRLGSYTSPGKTATRKVVVKYHSIILSIHFSIHTICILFQEL